MGFLSVLSFAHRLCVEHLDPGDIAIDATAGTGADTLFLARTVGRKGQVFSFDIQAEALRLTQERLDRQPPNTALAEVTLLQRSHAEMREVIPAEMHGRVGAVMFNLGYLPAEGADTQVITEPASTLAALQAALELLRPRGVITAVLYPGHPGGEIEAAEVENFASCLPSSSGQSILYRQIQRKTAPYLVAIEKR